MEELGKQQAKISVLDEKHDFDIYDKKNIAYYFWD